MILRRFGKVITQSLLKNQKYRIATFNTGEYFITENNQQIPYLQNVVQTFDIQDYQKEIQRLMNQKKKSEKENNKILYELLYICIKCNDINKINELIKFYLKQNKNIEQDQLFVQLYYFAQKCLKQNKNEQLDTINIKLKENISTDQIIQEQKNIEEIQQNYIKGIFVFNILNNQKDLLSNEHISNFYFKQNFLNMDLFIVTNFLYQNLNVLENKIWNSYIQNIIGLNLEQLDQTTLSLLLDCFIQKEYLIKSKLLLKFFYIIQNNDLQLIEKQIPKIIYLMMKANYNNDALIQMLQNKIQKENLNDQNLDVMLQVSLKYFNNLDLNDEKWDFKIVGSEVLLYNLLSDAKYMNEKSNKKTCEYLKSQSIDKEQILSWITKMMYFQNRNFQVNREQNDLLKETFEIIITNHQDIFDKKEKDLINSASIMILKKNLFNN